MKKKNDILENLTGMIGEQTIHYNRPTDINIIWPSTMGRIHARRFLFRTCKS